MTEQEAFEVASDQIAVACDVQSSGDTHPIVIAFYKYGQTGTAYEVTHRGQLLIENSRPKCRTYRPHPGDIDDDGAE
jgi:hypothetical protein